MGHAFGLTTQRLWKELPRSLFRTLSEKGLRDFGDGRRTGRVLVAGESFVDLPCGQEKSVGKFRGIERRRDLGHLTREAPRLTRRLARCALGARPDIPLASRPFGQKRLLDAGMNRERPDAD